MDEETELYWSDPEEAQYEQLSVTPRVDNRQILEQIAIENAAADEVEDLVNDYLEHVASTAPRIATVVDAEGGHLAPPMRAIHNAPNQLDTLRRRGIVTAEQYQMAQFNDMFAPGMLEPASFQDVIPEEELVAAIGGSRKRRRHDFTPEEHVAMLRGVAEHGVLAPGEVTRASHWRDPAVSNFLTSQVRYASSFDTVYNPEGVEMNREGMEDLDIIRYFETAMQLVNMPRREFLDDEFYVQVASALVMSAVDTCLNYQGSNMANEVTRAGMNNAADIYNGNPADSLDFTTFICGTICNAFLNPNVYRRMMASEYSPLIAEADYQTMESFLKGVPKGPYLKRNVRKGMIHRTPTVGATAIAFEELPTQTRDGQMWFPEIRRRDVPVHRIQYSGRSLPAHDVEAPPLKVAERAPIYVDDPLPAHLKKIDDDDRIPDDWRSALKKQATRKALKASGPVWRPHTKMEVSNKGFMKGRLVPVKYDNITLNHFMRLDGPQFDPFQSRDAETVDWVDYSSAFITAALQGMGFALAGYVMAFYSNMWKATVSEAGKLYVLEDARVHFCEMPGTERRVEEPFLSGLAVLFNKTQLPEEFRGVFLACANRWGRDMFSRFRGRSIDDL